MEIPNQKFISKCDRRNFIYTTSKIIGTISLLSVPGISSAFVKDENLTVKQVINKILAHIPGAQFSETVDTLKVGNESDIVKGIVTTTFASVEVINKTIKLVQTLL